MPKKKIIIQDVMKKYQQNRDFFDVSLIPKKFKNKAHKTDAKQEKTEKFQFLCGGSDDDRQS